MIGNKSIGIIGMGLVGSSTAISILHAGIAQELLLYDIKEDIAEGEAMDLSHGSSFYPSAKVSASSIEDMMDTDAIVIAAGRGGKPGETRLQLLNENVSIAKDIASKIKGYQGVVVVISNPVDVLTYFIQQYSDIPPCRVIGTGTMLDTARLKEILGREFDVAPRSIHAQVIGEHGDSEVVLWSGATIGSIQLQKWQGWNPSREKEIETEVRESAQQIIKRKGSTNHAIGLVTSTLLKWLFRDEKRIITVSTVHDELYGFKNVAISLPAIVGINGVIKVLSPDMNDKEKQRLIQSIEVIQKAIKSTEG